MTDYSKLENKLKIKFNNLELITKAFTHRSYLNENKTKKESNERLEFLGDSILSYLISSFLFDKYPKLPEGELTNLRSSVVKTTTLAQIAKDFQLGEFLLLSHGEEESGGRKNPSLLADTFEAFLGAVFLDSGINNIINILKITLFPMIPKIYQEKSYRDAKSILQETVQNNTKISPIYKVIKEEGPDHSKIFTLGVYVDDTLWGVGVGKNKQQAEQMAARTALVKWNKK